MTVENTGIKDVNVVLSEPFKDNRGFLNRIFCQKELENIRPNIIIAQVNHTMTKVKGTIRGMHFQYPPHAEMKIVYCVRGSIFDVAVDLRKDSPTFLQWHGEILSAENMKALVVPEGCAHGFQSLEDNIEMVYFVTSFYCKDAEDGVRHDDPKIGIKWPCPVVKVSERDMLHSFITNDFRGIV
jgi:dTDP-4-dehydrorhamnose 3,5-epimerase